MSVWSRSLISMMKLYFTTSFIVQIAFAICIEEPACLSRFDYDYKMLTKMVDLETQYKLDKDAGENQIQELMDKLDDMTSLLNQYKQDLDDTGNLLIVCMSLVYEYIVTFWLTSYQYKWNWKLLKYREYSIYHIIIVYKP